MFFINVSLNKEQVPEIPEKVMVCITPHFINVPTW